MGTEGLPPSTHGTPASRGRSGGRAGQRALAWGLGIGLSGVVILFALLLRNDPEVGVAEISRPGISESPETSETFDLAKGVGPVAGLVESTGIRREPELGPSFDYDGERRVEGRVVFPEGTPEDEEAYVVLECAQPVWRGPEDTDDSHAVNELFMTTSHRVARVPLDASGEFELEVPSNTGWIQLDVEGRYLHLPSKARLFASEIDEPQVLEPELGGGSPFESCLRRRVPWIGASSSDARSSLRTGHRALSAGRSPGSMRNSVWSSEPYRRR